MRSFTAHIFFANFLVSLLCGVPNVLAAQDFDIFPMPELSLANASDWQRHGTGTVDFSGSALRVHDAWAVAANRTWVNPRIDYETRTTLEGEEVQIWSGFGFQDRDTRYALGIRGGETDDILLYRYEASGRNQFLGRAALEFHPVPGQWIAVRIEQWLSRIRVSVNNHLILDVHDSDPLPAGSVVLGGGWIESEFRALSVRSLGTGEISGWPEISDALTTTFQPAEKEQQRIQERRRYRSRKIRFEEGRQEISLDGNWLFRPDYETLSDFPNEDPDIPDENWHIIPVPAFWTPQVYVPEEYTPEGLPPAGDISDRLRERETARCRDFSFDYTQTSGGWYRHWLEFPGRIPEQRVILVFEGAAKWTELWVNDQFAGEYVGFFGEQKYDITSLIQPGRNLIAVHVSADIPLSSSVFTDTNLPVCIYTGKSGGIWQPVKLMLVPEIHLHGIDAEMHTAGGEITADIVNESNEGQAVHLEVEIKVQNSRKKLTRTVTDPIYIEPSDTPHQVRLSLENLKPALWTPENPNLYTVSVSLLRQRKVIDKLELTTGFRTIECRAGTFLLNSSVYRFRGAGQPPHGSAPGDADLAAAFLSTMHDHHMTMTYSSGFPFTEAWLSAADAQGVGVNFGGVWPGLMDRGMPPIRLLRIWQDEWLSLVRKYKHHPSILLWTINQNMSFSGFNAPESASDRLDKWQVVSDLVRRTRQLDSSRPVNSSGGGYSRISDDYQLSLQPFGVDDGDINNRTFAPGWTDPALPISPGMAWTETQPDIYSNQRPMILHLQTGISSTDTGHPIREFSNEQSGPYTWTGNWTREDHNPDLFQEAQANNLKKLIEVTRRSDTPAAGIFISPAVSWFQHSYDWQALMEFPSAAAIKTAYQPILISAEFPGTHFYGGTRSTVRVAVVHDDAAKERLKSPELHWKLTAYDKSLAEDRIKMSAIQPNQKRWHQIQLEIPEALPADKTQTLLQLELHDGRDIVSRNQYELLLASAEWVKTDSLLQSTSIGLYDPSRSLESALRQIGLETLTVPDLSAIRFYELDILLVGAVDKETIPPFNWQDLPEMAASVLQILLVHPGKHLLTLLPHQIRSIIDEPSFQASVHIPESPVFTGIDPTDLTGWKSDLQTSSPVSRRSFRLQLPISGQLLCTTASPRHVVLENDSRESLSASLAEFNYGAGRLIVCELELETAGHEPAAARIFKNLIQMMEDETASSLESDSGR